MELTLDDIEIVNNNMETVTSNVSESPVVNPIAIDNGSTNMESSGFSLDDVELVDTTETTTNTTEPVKETFTAPPAPIPVNPNQPSETTLGESLGKGLTEAGKMLAPQPMKEVLAGAARLPLGIMGMSEDIANIFGADSNAVSTLIKENESNINEWNKNNPDRPINPSTIGDLASNFVAGLYGKTTKSVAGIEGVVEFFKSLGQGEDYSDSTKRGIFGAALAGVTYKAVDYVLSKDAFSGLSKKMQTVLRSKDDAQLQEYLDMLNFAKEKDIKLFDSMLEGDLKTIESSNLFGKEQIAKLADTFESSELKAINNIIKQEVKSFKELGEKFQSESKSLRAKYRAEEEALYKQAEDLGGSNTYNIKTLQEQVVNTLRAEGAEQSVINAVKRELFHMEKTMLPEEKATRKAYESARKTITSLTKKLNQADPKQKGRYTMLLNAAKRKRDKLKLEVDGFEETAWLSNKQLMKVVQRINSDIFTRGGQSWGSSDAAAKRMADLAKEQVRDYITNINKNNPKFLDAYKKANEKSTERFGLFGGGDKGTKDFPELARALHTKDSEQLARSIIGNQSKFKLEMLDKVLGKELSNDFISKYVKESLELTQGKTVRGDELFQIDKVNTDRLATRLTNLVGDKDNYNFLSKTYGEQAAKDLLSLQKIANGLKTDINALRDRTSQLDKGLLNYLGEKGYIGGTLKILKDGMIHITNKMLSREPYMRTKELDKTIKALEKHLSSDTKMSIVQRLKNAGAMLDDFLQRDGISEQYAGGGGIPGKSLNNVEDALNMDVKKADAFIDNELKEISGLSNEHLNSLGLKGMERVKYLKQGKDTILKILAGRKADALEEYNSMLEVATKKSGNPKLRKWADGEEVEFAYHGTSKDFDSFNLQPDSYSIHNVDGVYVSSNPDTASKYATDYTTRGSNVMPLIIRKKNIANWHDTKVNPKDFGMEKVFGTELLPLKKVIGNSRLLNQEKVTQAQVTESMKKLGFSGIKDGPDTVLFNYKRDIKSKYSDLFDSDNGKILSVIGSALAISANKEEN